MTINIPDYVRQVMTLVKTKTDEVYLVGGCVRDSLLGRTIKDYDLTTDLKPDELQKLFNENNLKTINTNGEKHGTISVLVDGQIVEVTTFRQDGQSKDHRRPDAVTFTTSLEEDLRRRDLTINALAYNDEKGLVDLVGGLKDLEDKVIRTVGDPFERFEEDYLRILRALRFASKLKFDIEKDTAEAINKKAIFLKNISGERKREELKEILISKNVKEILLKYKDVFAILIPELKETMGFIQNNKYHIHQDVYEHIVNVVHISPADYIIRLSALLHDIGKPQTYSEEIIDNKINGHFYGHALISKEISLKILSNLKFSKKEIEDISFLIEYHDYDFIETKKSVKKLLLKMKNKSNEEKLVLLKRLLSLRLADRLDHQNLKLPVVNLDNIFEIARTIIAENEALKITDLAIDGYDLINVGFKGREIGEMLKHIFEMVIFGDLKNEKNTLLSYIKNN